MAAIQIYPQAFSPLERFLRQACRVLWLAAEAGRVCFRMVADATIPGESQPARAFREAVREFSPLIERICFGYASTVAELEDLKQDTLLNLWESMPKYRGNCSMKTWVFRITLNTCVTTIRKNNRRVNTVSLTELYDSIDGDDERKSTVAEIHECIARLNPIDKAVMMLWLEEESYDEIAVVTGLTRGNVAVRIHRAKEKLKTMITR